jgi:hypothetical protein
MVLIQIIIHDLHFTTHEDPVGRGFVLTITKPSQDIAKPSSGSIQTEHEQAGNTD